MKFGLLFDFANPEPWRRSGVELFEELLGQIEEIEALGFDSVWIGEHHFARDWNVPSSLTVAAAVAARTSAIRIGTWAVLLPLHNPLTLAEDALTVDQFADGRFELGVVGGYRKEEFAGFGVPREERAERMEEGLTVLARALRGERFSFSGRLYSFSNVHITPLPTRGSIRLWSGGQSKGPARRAARHRCHFIPSGPHIRPLYDAYASQLISQGDNPAHFEMIGFFPWFVDKHPSKRYAQLRPHLVHRVEVYRKWYEESGDFSTGRGKEWAEAILAPARQTASGDLIGDPQTVFDGVCEFARRAPYSEIISWFSPTGLDSHLAMESLRLFARELLPDLRKLRRLKVMPSSQTKAGL